MTPSETHTARGGQLVRGPDVIERLALVALLGESHSPLSQAEGALVSALAFRGIAATQIGSARATSLRVSRMYARRALDLARRRPSFGID